MEHFIVPLGFPVRFSEIQANWISVQSSFTEISQKWSLFIIIFVINKKMTQARTEP